MASDAAGERWARSGARGGSMEGGGAVDRLQPAGSAAACASLLAAGGWLLARCQAACPGSCRASSLGGSSSPASVGSHTMALGQHTALHSINIKSIALSRPPADSLDGGSGLTSAKPRKEQRRQLSNFCHDVIEK